MAKCRNDIIMGKRRKKQNKKEKNKEIQNKENIKLFFQKKKVAKIPKRK